MEAKPVLTNVQRMHGISVLEAHAHANCLKSDECILLNCIRFISLDGGLKCY